ncbi:hypothetical protein ASD00_32695 [Ensifer sp. Root31]|uniref:hypothetical protein n=1 Tax=Ensifer sp. Root31 TaxID=1736512 RepID=UPI00070CCD92|nr:hypothetical protein [Ensifer sp. Root31]KQU85448.1 hypothetical protein ASD00_32695 [Ensifer sp. Root31]
MNVKKTDILHEKSSTVKDVEDLGDTQNNFEFEDIYQDEEEAEQAEFDKATQIHNQRSKPSSI